MYNCLIDIAVFGDTSIVDAFKAVPTPEDCEINLTLSADSSALSSKNEKAFILGSYTDFLKNKDKLSDGYVAVITDGKLMPCGFDPETMDIWAIPEDSTCREELLKTYFSALIKKIKLNFDYRRLKICYETTADISPELVWVKDLQGAHLLTNDAFCRLVGKTKEQMYKKEHYYIWNISKEEFEKGEFVCQESEDVVIKSGKACLFDEKVKSATGVHQLRTIKSPLYDTNGELFGTCGIARDVTNLHRVNSELTVILESVPFGVMIEDNNQILISANAALKKFFPEISRYEGKNCSEWKQRVLGESEQAGVDEFAVKFNGLPRILRFTKEVIYDIFDDVMGTAIIFQDMTAERIFQKKALQNANTDFLTGLNNRRSLFNHLDRIKTTYQLSMITVDLDNFKKINDTYGHKMGDTALVETADILNFCFKRDFIARLGGDEFLVVITRKVSRKQLEREAQNLIDSFNARFSGKSEFDIMSISLGISTSYLPESGEHNTEAVMYSSDCALYESKKAGKSRYSFYEE